MTDHTRLRDLAENATPGPWSTSPANGALVVATIEDDYIAVDHCIYTCGDVASSQADAEYIAAVHPQIVLDLLDRIATLTTQVRNQAAELDDTRAAAVLAQRRLDACREGRSTYEGTER